MTQRVSGAIVPSRRPDFGITSVAVDGVPVAVQERTVAERTFSRLTHFARQTPVQPLASSPKAGKKRVKTPPPLPRMVMVAPLSSNFAYVMRDTVLALLPRHDIYLVEWQDARDVPAAEGGFGLDECIGEILCHVRALEPGVHLLGLCQSVVPTFAATSLLAQAQYEAEPKSLTLISGPIDPRVSPTRVDELIRGRTIDWLDQYALSTVGPLWPGGGRRVYASETQRSGLMAYLARHMAAGKELQRKVLHDDGSDPIAHPFLGHFLALMDLPSEVFLDTMRVVFHEAQLPQGEMKWYGVRVEPQAITKTALLTIEGSDDDIAGIGQTEAAHDLTPNLADALRFRYRQPEVGHFGTFHGAPWRRDIAPLISGFIERHEKRK